MKKNHISIVLIVLFCTTINAQKNIYWRGGADGADNGDWFGDNGCTEIGQGQSNWYYPDFTNNEARDQPNCNDGSTDQHFLNFDNDHQVLMNVNSALSICRLLFQNTTSNTSREISGSDITIANTNSNTPKIENYSSAVHTINSNIIINSGGEINPVNGSLTLGGNINNNSNNIQVYGDNGHTLTIGGVLSGSGNLSIEQNSTVVIDSDATMSGSTTLNAGTLQLNASMSSSAITVNSGATLKISDDATISSLVVNAGGIVIVDAGKSLNITGNLTNNGSSFNVNSGASLLVGGTSAGNLTYNRNLSTLNQWYLVSSPFSGETIADMRTSHTFVSGTEDTDHLSFAPYNNAAAVSTERWDYITASSTGTLRDAQGYLAQLNAVGDISFTGTMNTSDFTAIDLTDNSGSSGTAFNFLGNPYPSFIDIGDLLTANDSGGNDLLTEATVWIWNGSSYDERNSGTASPNDYIAPAQGFFVSADGGSSTFTITEAMQSHQGTDSFQKSANTRTELQLIINDGTNRKDADIFYIDGTSTGFDNGYDSSIFSGVENKFAIYTEAVANGTGKKLGIQSLPNSDLESMVIPVGITADAGEITFSAETVNFPSELKVFLEDRENNTFTRLDEINSSYVVTLSEKTDGIGRFYLHTNSSALSTDNVQLENISIYKANASLRIVGLSQGKANVKLFNILGEQVLNTNFTSNGVYDVSLPQLVPGVYIAQLKNENGTINKKIVLE